MMKKNSSIARWICLTLVVAMACVMVPTLAAAAPPVTAPAEPAALRLLAVSVPS